MTLVLKGKTIGENIRLARLKAGITVTQLADALVVAPAMVSKYESGDRPITERKLCKVAEVCGVTVRELTEVSSEEVGQQVADELE